MYDFITKTTTITTCIQFGSIPKSCDFNLLSYQDDTTSISYTYKTIRLQSSTPQNHTTTISYTTKRILLQFPMLPRRYNFECLHYQNHMILISFIIKRMRLQFRTLPKGYDFNLVHHQNHTTKISYTNKTI